MSGLTEREAREALQYMAQHSHGDAVHQAYGYVWATLRRAAGLGDLPLPCFIGPPRREHALFWADLS